MTLFGFYLAALIALVLACQGLRSLVDKEISAVGKNAGTSPIFPGPQIAVSVAVGKPDGRTRGSAA